MRLRGPQTSFELRLLRHPDCEDWCMVRIDVLSPWGRWSASDPCLRGAEVRLLADWLDGLDLQQATPSVIEFLEPELRFEFPSGERRLLRVYFSWHMRPRWVSEDVPDFCVDFP